MRLMIEMFIDEPVSDDVDVLTELTTNAISEAIGEADFVVQDIGLSFELQDDR